VSAVAGSACLAASATVAALAAEVLTQARALRFRVAKSGRGHPGALPAKGGAAW